MYFFNVIIFVTLIWYKFRFTKFVNSVHDPDQLTNIEWFVASETSHASKSSEKFVNKAFSYQQNMLNFLDPTMAKNPSKIPRSGSRSGSFRKVNGDFLVQRYLSGKSIHELEEPIGSFTVKLLTDRQTPGKTTLSTPRDETANYRQGRPFSIHSSSIVYIIIIILNCIFVIVHFNAIYLSDI